MLIVMLQKFAHQWLNDPATFWCKAIEIKIGKTMGDLHSSVCS